MFKKFINYFYNDEFSLLLSNDKLYINNYERVIDITDNSLKLTVNGKKIDLIGEGITIKKLDKKEMLISGTIKRIDINDK